MSTNSLDEENRSAFLPFSASGQSLFQAAVLRAPAPVVFQGSPMRSHRCHLPIHSRVGLLRLTSKTSNCRERLFTELTLLTPACQSSLSVAVLARFCRARHRSERLKGNSE